MSRRGYVSVDPPGTGAADLTAPTPPAQGPPEASGTTSVSVTYTHAGAPAGTTWEIIVTDQSDGSTVTPSSGSGLGPYVLPTTNGCRYVHQMRATGPDGQEALSLARIVVVEAAGAETPGWDTVLDLDLTGLTVATLSSGPATQTVTRAVGGATVATVWTHAASNAGTITAGATGITADGASGTGSVSALIDIEAAAGLTLPIDAMAGLAVTLYLTGATDMGTSANAVRVGISATQERFSIGTCNTVQLVASGSGVHDRRISTAESFTTWASAQTNPAAAWTVTLLILGGDSVWAFYGTSAASDADLDALTGAVRCSGTITADVSDAMDSTRYGAALHAGIMGQLQAGTTWTRATVRRRRT